VKTILLKMMNKEFLGLVILVIVIGFFLVGLWPFNFIPENQVQWLKDTNGISFYGNGMMYTPNHLNQGNSPYQDDSITIEIWLQPRVKYNHFMADILSLYDDRKSEIFLIGQWEDSIILRHYLKKPDNNKQYKEVGLDNILIKDKTVFITITSGDSGTTIYVDGKTAKLSPQFKLITDNSISGNLIIGNSLTGKRYWTGELYGIALYNGVLLPDQILNNYLSWTKSGAPELSYEKVPLALYLFNEHSGTKVTNHSAPQDLIIPAILTILKKDVLTPPWESFRLNRSHVKDVLINFFGFIPFGFFFRAYLLKSVKIKREKIAILTVLTGGGISLIIELLQVNLPTRSSSLTDLILNTAGTAAGIILFNMTSGYIENPD